jgi:hypothetical protein
MMEFERVVLKWNVPGERLVAGHVGTGLHV